MFILSLISKYNFLLDSSLFFFENFVLKKEVKVREKASHWILKCRADAINEIAYVDFLSMFDTCPFSTGFWKNLCRTITSYMHVDISKTNCVLLWVFLNPQKNCSPVLSSTTAQILQSWNNNIRQPSFLNVVVLTMINSNNWTKLENNIVVDSNKFTRHIFFEICQVIVLHKF